VRKRKQKIKAFPFLFDLCGKLKRMVIFYQYYLEISDNLSQLIVYDGFPSKH
jgi:hypothetical protein